MKAILIEFQKTCDKQNKLVTNNIDKVGLQFGNDFIARSLPIGTLDYLTKIDLQVFLQNFEPIFPKKIYSKAISKLFNLLAIIKSQNECLEKVLNYFSDRFSVSERNYHQNIDALRRIFDELAVKYNGKEILVEEGGQLIQDYADIFSKWIKNGAITNIYSTYSEIVVPIKGLGKSHKTSPLILPISNHALQCHYAFANIDKIEKSLKVRYNEFAFAHRNASKLLTVILKII
jgi:hypothetical protein